MVKWTREQIIREILRRESEGLNLTASKKQGVDSGLYEAASRVFGSWRNAIVAAGVPPKRARSHDSWPPAKILANIRLLGRRQRPLSPTELQNRHSGLVAAARRVFGSWSKAVIAAGADPERFRRVVQWTPERIIEEILTRVLRNAPLAARSVQPRSLADAGARIFGSWRAAIVAAGIDPTLHASRRPIGSATHTGERDVERNSKPVISCAPGLVDSGSVSVRQSGQRWTTEAVTHAILSRHRDRRAINAVAVYRDDRALYRAATRRHGNWRNSLIAAGLDPSQFGARACV